MFREAEEGPIQSDAYIDALLSGHARQAIQLPAGPNVPAPGVRQVIRLLERGLPRYHPSFAFEEHLAGQLRATAASSVAQGVALDRRVVFGSVLASGVSIGAAMWAWRRRPHTDQAREA
jgi:hypothetical protein